MSCEEIDVESLSPVNTVQVDKNEVILINKDIPSDECSLPEDLPIFCKEVITLENEKSNAILEIYNNDSIKLIPSNVPKQCNKILNASNEEIVHKNNHNDSNNQNIEVYATCDKIHMDMENLDTPDPTGTRNKQLGMIALERLQKMFMKDEKLPNKADIQKEDSTCKSFSLSENEEIEEVILEFENSDIKRVSKESVDMKDVNGISNEKFITNELKNIETMNLNKNSADKMKKNEAILTEEESIDSVSMLIELETQFVEKENLLFDKVSAEKLNNNKINELIVNDIIKTDVENNAKEENSQDVLGDKYKRLMEISSEKQKNLASQVGINCDKTSQFSEVSGTINGNVGSTILEILNPTEQLMQSAPAQFLSVINERANLGSSIYCDDNLDVGENVPSQLDAHLTTSTTDDLSNNSSISFKENNELIIENENVSKNRVLNSTPIQDKVDDVSNHTGSSNNSEKSVTGAMVSNCSANQENCPKKVLTEKTLPCNSLSFIINSKMIEKEIFGNIDPFDQKSDEAEISHPSSVLKTEPIVSPEAFSYIRKKCFKPFTPSASTSNYENETHRKQINWEDKSELSFGKVRISHRYSDRGKNDWKTSNFRNYTSNRFESTGFFSGNNFKRDYSDKLYNKSSETFYNHDERSHHRNKYNSEFEGGRTLPEIRSIFNRDDRGGASKKGWWNNKINYGNNFSFHQNKGGNHWKSKFNYPERCYQQNYNSYSFNNYYSGKKRYNRNIQPLSFENEFENSQRRFYRKNFHSDFEVSSSSTPANDSGFTDMYAETSYYSNRSSSKKRRYESYSDEDEVRSDKMKIIEQIIKKEIDACRNRVRNSRSRNFDTLEKKICRNLNNREESNKIPYDYEVPHEVKRRKQKPCSSAFKECLSKYVYSREHYRTDCYEKRDYDETDLDNNDISKMKSIIKPSTRKLVDRLITGKKNKDSHDSDTSMDSSSSEAISQLSSSSSSSSSSSPHMKRSKKKSGVARGDSSSGTKKRKHRSRKKIQRSKKEENLDFGLEQFRNLTHWIMLSCVKRFSPSPKPNDFTGIQMGLIFDSNLAKWVHLDIDSVILVEKHKPSLDRTEQSYREIKNNGHDLDLQWIEKDYTREVWRHVPADIAYSHLTLHSAFASASQIELLAYNLSCSLEEDACLVTTAINTTKIVSLIRSAGKERSCNNKYFKVKLSHPISQPLPKFGVTLSLTIGEDVFKDCLVQMKTVEDIFSSHQLQLVCTRTFMEYFDETCGSSDTLKQLRKLHLAYKGLSTRDRLCPMVQNIATLFDVMIFRKK